MDAPTTTDLTPYFSEFLPKPDVTSVTVTDRMPSNALDWLKAHQEAVFLGAAGLFVLALVMGGRRR